MYKDYKKKSKFFAIVESVESGIGSFGLENATYVKIKKSVKSSDWYSNLDNESKKSVDFLLATDHNIRVAGVKSTPLAGYATATGEEVVGEKMVSVYDEMAIGLMGVMVTLPAKFVEKVEYGPNRIPKIPKDWQYDGKTVMKPSPVKTEPRYTNPTKNTVIPSHPIKSAPVKKAKKVN